VRALRLAAIALLGAASSCTAEPSFYRTDGVRTYGCYLDEGARSHIEVVFSNQGRAAVLTVEGQTHQLTYRGNRWFKDVYANDAVEMSLDPEAFVFSHGETLVGPCD
jgi:hypothetical protein